MARVVFLFLVFTFIFAGLVHGRPKKEGTKSIGVRSNQGFAAFKTRLQNALNENSAPAILSALRSLPKICSTMSPPSATPVTQAANTMANQQDFGWLFDLVSAALSQPTIQKMKIVLKSSPKLRRKLCGGGRSTRPSTRPTSLLTPTPPRPATTQPAPLPVVATNPEVKTEAAGVSSFVDVALKDEGKSGNRAKRTRPTAPTRPATASGQPASPTLPRATEQPPADAVNDKYYSDEFLSIPAMRKRRSLDSDDDQEAEKTGPMEENETREEREMNPASKDGVDEGGETGSLEHRETMKGVDEQEFHISAVIPATVFPAEDEQAAVPRVKISASNLLEDGQFDETITIYPEYHDQAAATNQDEQEQKKEETLQDQKTLDSNAETSSQQTEATPKLRDEAKLEVTRSKNEEIKSEDPLDENMRADDVMVTKKEMFSADEMPEQLPSPEENQGKKDYVHDQNNDDQLMTENKKNLDLLPVEPNQMMRKELDELEREDWQVKKAPKGEEIKYEVDDKPAERITKRKAKNRLKTMLRELRKKNT